MFLWEIPRKDSIVISFDLKSRRFNFKASIFNMACREKDSIYVEPIVISGRTLCIDERCQNIEIKYLNSKSGRTHTWRDVTVRYEKPPKDLYVLTSEKDSKQINRRKAIRVAVNELTDCNISLLDGRYKCIISDLSVTGVGINLNISLAEKKLFHRTIHTQYIDPDTKIRYDIMAKCIHCTRLDAKTVRCGCELVSVHPPINELVNAKQVSKYTKSSLRDIKEDIIDLTEIEADLPAAPITEMTEEEALKAEWFSSSMQEYVIGEGALCPVCEQGRLHLSDGFFICDDCGSMLD